MTDLPYALGFEVLTIGLFGEGTRLFCLFFREAQCALGLFETTKLRCQTLEENREADHHADSGYDEDQRLPMPEVDSDNAEFPDRKIRDGVKDQAEGNEERARA